MHKNKGYEARIKELIRSPQRLRISAKAIFRELETKSIYIYGAGNAGAMTYKLLLDRNLEVEGFFDRNGGAGRAYFGKPVYGTGQEVLSGKSAGEAAIIIAFLCKSGELEEMQQQLLQAGWKYIYYFHNIYYAHGIERSLCFEQGKKDEAAAEPDSGIINSIIETASLLKDDKSFEIFYKFFEAVVSGNPEHFSPPSEEFQYFVKDISLKKGYSRFIDCGAFSGDTAEALTSQKGMVDAIVLFEPDPDNFKLLCRNLKEHRAAKEQVLFPCGVWNQCGMLRFRSGIKSSSGISDAGDTYIQCISIDDAIGDFAPTFIKMDIEGAEYEALTGAEQTIRRYLPDLAISIYHRIEHLWQIPLLIKSMDEGYGLYIRSHGLHGMETILYAVHGEE